MLEERVEQLLLSKRVKTMLYKPSHLSRKYSRSDGERSGK
jgi:hypothetical protein